MIMLFILGLVCGLFIAMMVYVYMDVKIHELHNKIAFIIQEQINCKEKSNESK
jgi:uncharacterized membrane protein YciS (DUF1049 family)